MSQITIVEAAKRTGYTRVHINKLINDNKLSYSLNLKGVKVVEESELFRLCPPKSEAAVALLEAKLETEKEKNILLQRHIDDLRTDKERLIQEADSWKKQVNLLTYEKKSWWKKLFSRKNNHQ